MLGSKYREHLRGKRIKWFVLSRFMKEVYNMPSRGRSFVRDNSTRPCNFADLDCTWLRHEVYYSPLIRSLLDTKNKRAS